MKTVPVASNDNKTFTIDPTTVSGSTLSTDGAVYLIRVTTDAKDTSGNPLSGNGSYGWTGDNVSTFMTVKE